MTDSGGLITAYHTSDDFDKRIYVADLVLKDGRRARSVVPNGKVTKLGDLELNSSNLYGRELTIKCLSYEVETDVYATTVDYVESTETNTTTTGA